MADTFIQLAPDGSGKKLSAQSRVQGANTVYNPYWNDYGQRVTSGAYGVATPATAIASAANTLSTGYFYLYNPIGSSLVVALFQIDMRLNKNATTVDATSPRLLLERFTYTGTPTGALATIAALYAAYPTATAVARTAGTGMTCTTAGVVTNWFPPVTLTSISSPPAPFELIESDWQPNAESGHIILRAGEGVVLWQPDTGTGATRLFQANFLWEEFTIPA